MTEKPEDGRVVDHREIAGPPARLLSRNERSRRRRAVALSAVLIGTLAVFLTVFTLHSATRPNTKVHLGSDTFKVGEASALAASIRTDNYPLLFQDLRGGAIDVFVDHDRGKPSWQGWRAIEAHAPNAPRTCQLKWTGNDYRDPCTGATFPRTGEGLRRFAVSVDNGSVIVDFRKTA